MIRINDWIRNRKVLGWIAVFVLTVLLALTVVHLTAVPSARTRHVFWFPDTTRSRLNPEWRFIPARESRRESIEVFLEELLLGPTRMGSIPYVRRDVKIRSVMLDDRDRLYLDFSPELIFGREDVEVSIDDLSEHLRKNLKHNFPFLDQVVITIDGQIPNVPRFRMSTLTKARGTL